NVPILLALAVGVVAGWAAANGTFTTVVSAQPQLVASTVVELPCPEAGPCCGPNPVAAHNQMVFAKLQQSGRKPNILMIMGDDIGWFNPSCYHNGIMGYQTPNIDRIAKEGARFTDWYGQQSCTAGRAAFVTGQSPIRTGLTKVGLPGA